MKQVKDKSKQTVSYIRSNNNESLGQQITKSEKYAQQQSLSINIIVDINTSSSKPLFERSGMRSILKMVENRNINTLIVDSLCRVSRDGYQLFLFKHFLSEYNTKLIVLDGGI